MVRSSWDTLYILITQRDVSSKKLTVRVWTAFSSGGGNVFNSACTHLFKFICLSHHILCRYIIAAFRPWAEAVINNMFAIFVLLTSNIISKPMFPFRRTARLGFRCAACFVVIHLYCSSGEILFTPVLLLDRPELLFVWSVLVIKTKVFWDDVTPCRLVNSDVSNNLIMPSYA